MSTVRTRHHSPHAPLSVPHEVGQTVGIRSHSVCFRTSSQAQVAPVMITEVTGTRRLLWYAHISDPPPFERAIAQPVEPSECCVMLPRPLARLLRVHGTGRCVRHRLLAMSPMDVVLREPS